MGGAGVGGHQRFCLAHSHAARERSRVAPGFVFMNHTQVFIANLCGSAPYPALTQIDVVEEAVAVGWLSWLVRVHSIAIIMYDI